MILHRQNLDAFARFLFSLASLRLGALAFNAYPDTRLSAWALWCLNGQCSLASLASLGVLAVKSFDVSY